MLAIATGDRIPIDRPGNWGGGAGKLDREQRK